MMNRFASASAVAAVAIAVGAVTLVFLLDPLPEAGYRLTRLWCVVPAFWGLWAMITPKAWVPERLPVWGAILGLIAGLLAIFVLNIPAQVVGVQLPMTARGLGVLLAIAFYYLLWLLVRAVYRSLVEHPLPH